MTPKKVSFIFTGLVRPAEKGDWIACPQYDAWEHISAWMFWNEDRPSVKEYMIWRRVEE